MFKNIFNKNPYLYSINLEFLNLKFLKRKHQINMNNIL